MHFLFGSVSVLNALGLSFFFYFPRKIHIVLIDPWVDIVAWVVSAVCLSILTIWSSKGRRMRPLQVGLALPVIILAMVLLSTQGGDASGRIDVFVLFIFATLAFAAQVLPDVHVTSQLPSASLQKVLIYLLASFAAIEASAATHFILRSFDQTTRVGFADASIELQISYASYNLLPWLYVAFLFSWAWVPLVQWLWAHNRFFQTTRKTASGNQDLFVQQPPRRLFSTLLDPRFVLAIAFAIFIGYYPYFQNPPWLVGTDAYWRYYNPLQRMNANGISGGFVQALNERHPMPLALLYAAQLMFQTTAFAVVRLAPIFLVLILAWSTWWFLARKRSMSFGLIAFTLSALSITTTVGLYASILANWMALVVWAAFFAYAAFRGDEGFRLLDGVILLILSTLILLIHPWTWGVFATAVFLVGILTLVQEKRRGLRGGITFISVVVIDAAFALVTLTLLSASQGWRVADALGDYTASIANPASLLYFWSALTRLTQVWAAFFSSLYLGVSILGVFCMTAPNVSPWRRRLILAWIFVSGLGSILAAPIGFDPAQPTRSESDLWRLLFLTPFQLTAPFGIAWLTQLPYRFQMKTNDNPGSSDNRTIAMWLGAVFAAGVLLAWGPIWLRVLLMAVALPVATALVLQKGGRIEGELLGYIVLASFVLVAFNNTTRALSQLLIDPHNYICTTC
jgi:hypothetical protein